MATLTDFCALEVTLDFQVIGQTGTGFRLDVPFSGTATSPNWEGERPVDGIDFVTVGADGIQSLDIRGRIGTGTETIGYRAIGRGTDAGPCELFVFETADESMSHLNSAIGVGMGTIDGTTLSLAISLVER